MVWDIFLHVVGLDFWYLPEVILGNLLWVFMFFSVGYIFFDGKKALRAFVHVSLAGMFFTSLLPFLGWNDFAGPFLAFYYLADLAILKFAESIPFFAKRLVWVEESVFFGSLVFFNLFRW